MIRSDILASWHAFLADFPALAAATGVPGQLRLVVDANVVLSDLRWLVVKRRMSTARTTLEEVVAARTVIVYVPPVLHREVEKGLRDLSAEEGIPLDRLAAAWEQYRTMLRTLDAPSAVDPLQRAQLRDPDDVPYIDLCVGIHASAIYSEDHDLPGMSAPAVGKAVLRSAREYSREASVSFSIKIGGTLVCTAGIGLIVALTHVARAISRRIRSLPADAQFLLLSAGLLVLLNPGARIWIWNWLRRLSPASRNAAQLIAPGVASALQRASVATARAEEAWSAVLSAVPPRGLLSTQPLKVHVVVACLEARAPLTVQQIAERVRAQGFRAGRSPSTSYLRSILRGHPSLTQTSGRRWTLATT